MNTGRHDRGCSTRWLVSAIAALTIAAMGCGEKNPEPDRAASATQKSAPPIQAELLPLAATTPVLKPFTDQVDEASKRTPWDNYVLEDTLSEKFIRDGKTAPPPGTQTYPQYKADFVGALLRRGPINFKVVGSLYKDRLIERARAAEITQSLYDHIETHKGDPAMKANLIIGLIHIGFEEEAFTAIAKYKAEEWFAKDFDANFYAGTLFFRHRRYEEAVPFLESANAIQPTPWVRIWLRMALGPKTTPEAEARKAEIFPYGEHMGSGTAEDFPFVDRADFYGIRRWHLAGAVAFADFNNDTFVDFIAQGVYAQPELYLYENGKGFVRKEDKTLAGISNTPPACVAADFNNDGWTDLYMTRAAWLSAGPNRLLMNYEGKGFVDMSEKGDAALPWQNSCGASALDFDQDGLLDLAVTGTAGGRLVLLKNMGDFEFKDVSKEAQIEATKAVTVGVSTGDVDGDGWTDIFVNSLSPTKVERRGYEAPNGLYINNRDGTFREEGAKRGVADGTGFGFATWMFDYDNDGDLDILATNFVEGELEVLEGFQKAQAWQGALYGGPALYKNDGTGHFKNIGDTAGFVPASIMGAQFVDMDLDGDQDVILGPGSHPVWNAQPLFVYRNNGDDSFTNITPLDVPEYFGKFHGMAFADFDRDGDPDVIVNNGGIHLNDRFRDLVLENTTTDQNWLHVKLVGTKANSGGVGSRIVARFGDTQLLQEVSAGEGFSSTNTPYLIFGLGSATQVDSLTVDWIGGEPQDLGSVAANQALLITQGDATPKRVY
jgi:hypothetical protein